MLFLNAIYLAFLFLNIGCRKIREHIFTSFEALLEILEGLDPAAVKTSQVQDHRFLETLRVLPKPFNRIANPARSSGIKLKEQISRIDLDRIQDQEKMPELDVDVTVQKL